MSRVAAWAAKAACRHMVRADYDPWFAHPMAEQDLANEAKAVCAVCPVLAECTEDALADPRAGGIRGGLTEDDRRRLRGDRRRRRTA